MFGLLAFFIKLVQGKPVCIYYIGVVAALRTHHKTAFDTQKTFQAGTLPVYEHF